MPFKITKPGDENNANDPATFCEELKLDGSKAGMGFQWHDSCLVIALNKKN